MTQWVKNVSSCTQLTEWEKTYAFVCDMEVWWDTPKMEQQVARAVRTESHKEIEKDEFVPLEIQEKMRKNEKEERMRKESRKRAGR